MPLTLKKIKRIKEIMDCNEKLYPTPDLIKCYPTETERRIISSLLKGKKDVFNPGRSKLSDSTKR